MMKNNWTKFFVIFLIAAGAIVWSLSYLYLGGKTAQKSKASGETIEVSYDPAAPAVSAGQDITVMVKIKPSADVSLRGYMMKMKFNKDILNAKYIDYKLGVPSPEFGDTSGTLASVNETGTINIQGEIQNATGNVINGGATLDLVRIVFNAKSASGTTIDASNANFFFTKADGAIETNFISAIADLKVNGGAAAAACTSFTDDFSASTINQTKWAITTNNNGTITPGDADLIVANLPAATDSTSKNVTLGTVKSVGGDFETEVTIKSLAGNPATSTSYLTGLGFFGTDAAFDGFAIERSNSGQLKVLYDWNNTDWVSPTVVSTSLAPASAVKLKIKRTGANIQFHYDLMDGAGYRLAKSFDGGYIGTGALALYTKNSEPNYPAATSKFDNFALNCVAGEVIPTTPPANTSPTVPPAATPTGAIPVTGNTILNLKLKFQGITAKPADSKNMMNVKFTLSGDGIATPLVKSGSFVSDASGVWSGKVGFDLTAPAGKKYMLYIKGPRHVQKKICQNAPSETAAGTYKCSAEAITLTTGENALDFSKVLQLSGDIYGPDKGQDGIVNAIDISYVKNNLTKTAADILSFCDINLDNKCDTQDYSLIISALSIKSDEL